MVWTLAAAAVVVAGLLAAWWTADRWTPHAAPWGRSAWLKLSRPPPLEPDHAGGSTTRSTHAGPHDKPTPVRPRKCVQGDRTTYTDQACPAGSTEQLLEPARIALPQ